MFLDLGGLSLRRDRELKLATGTVEVAVRDADILEEDGLCEWNYESMDDETTHHRDSDSIFLDTYIDTSSPRFEN